MRREPTSDLYSTFGPRARLAQMRRLVQDAIDVFEALMMSRPERYAHPDDLEIRAGGPEGLAVSVSEGDARSEISLQEVSTA